MESGLGLLHHLTHKDKDTFLSWADEGKRSYLHLANILANMYMVLMRMMYIFPAGG